MSELNYNSAGGLNSEYQEDERKIRFLEGAIDVYEKKANDYKRIESGLLNDFDAAVKNVAKYTTIQDEYFKKSVKNAYLKVTRKYDEQYTSNQANLEKAQDELDRIKYRITDTRGRLRDVQISLENAKKEYNSHRAYMKAKYSDTNEYEQRIVNERARLNSIIKEIDEAIVAVDEVSQMAKLARDKYKEAEGFGVADIVFDSIFLDVAKYNRINSAQSYIYSLNASIARMNKELRDVNNIYNVYCQEFGSDLKIADMIFDNIFVDAAVLNRIKMSVNSLNTFIAQLSTITDNLKGNRKQVENELKEKML